ncbi:MAG: hypothetical protein AVDCRST_MAG72-2577 [uncultured Nocardioidaceae bacterium]|uniref:N-acetylmuramoyl-L-alanine amidase n=1 Tax=uncultured Nocardioidaceae bacterium TaxID=253824 RepID=A0A6J4MR86_9ACTN|nr:MAG: hypothetical protein AVDCRST_MAG72-2577 [uncultured Nocardioidaceae bacterium]
MQPTQNRLVLFCQQLLAAGTVLAVAVPAAGLVSLDIAAPEPGGPPSGAVPGASLVAGEPVEPEVSELPVDGVDPAGLDAVTDQAAGQENLKARLAALSAPAPVTGYATVGVTWGPEQSLGDDEIAVSVRSRDARTWSGWEQLEYHDDHAPHPVSAESAWAADLRPGTEPIVVGDVERVQVKVVTASGEAPADMQLSVVDPGAATTAVEGPAIDTAQQSGSGGGGDADLALSAGSVARPKIYSRAQWGADERLRDPGSLRYGTIRAGFVHHTVNANGYSSGQVPSLIRGIYAYHTQSRGWSDIGYNFIVDRFGRIWEGRYGGVARPVVGAHTLGYNEYSFAMSALGNFDVAQPPAAMLRAYGRLFGWKLSLHGVSATDTNQSLGGRSFRAINGHRDAGSTACPGRYLYAQLPKIRTLAREHQTADSSSEPPPAPPPVDPERSADLSGSSWPDLVVRERSSKQSFVVRTGGQVAFRPAESTGRHWDEMDLVTGTRDLTGDGVADMVARNADSLATGIYPGDGRGGFGAAVATTTRFADSDQLTGVRDFDGDGNNDLVARNASTKSLYLYPGDGDGGFAPKRLLASQWSYNLTQGVGDLDEDGRFELVARDRDGGMTRFSMSADGLGRGTAIAQNWDVFDLVTGVGDLTNDGEGDLVARNAASKLTYVYPGDGRGGLLSRVGPFREFMDLDLLTVPGQVGGSQRSDLVGRKATGEMVGLVNTGQKNVTGVDATGDVLGTADLMLNVGDWDRDERGDLMTRSAESGRMYLRRGDGAGHFGRPVLAGSGWGSIGSVSPVGDVTGDGNPDLVGRPRGGEMRVYPGNGSSGFRSSAPAASEITSRLSAGSPDRYDWMLNVGDANGDETGDLIAREQATGRLWLMPGTERGFAPRRFIADGFGRYDLAG